MIAVIWTVFIGYLSCVLGHSKFPDLSKDANLPTEMYLYAWPLVMTSLTRQSMFYCPDNRMMPLPVFPNPNLTAIVKPNVDTLYDACWINHEKASELTLSIPDTTDGLYFLFPLMDAWTNVVECPGWRTSGKGATSVLIRGPNSNSAPTEGQYDVVINSPTAIAYLLGRTNVEDQNNLVPTQQQLFSYELDVNEATKVKNSESYGGYSLGKSNPVEKIFAMTPEDFYNTFAELMISNPPIMPQDKEIVAKMQTQYGLVAGMLAST
jgi:hypothetical protein